MVDILAEGLVLGLAMGGYCAASCAPFMVPYLLATGSDGLAPRLRVFASFLAGRLAAYLVVAVAAALAGRALPDLVSPRMKGVLLIAAAFVLALFSLVTLRRKSCFCPGGRETGDRLAGGLPFLTGLLLGFNLCPPFAVAVFRGIEMAHPGRAAAYFGALFLGTTAYLAPAPFVSWWVSSDFTRRMGVYLGVLAGAWFLVQGVAAL